MRIWLQFAKEHPLRYLSHLDLMRTWQRALRRARLPVAHSEGFNPHPKMAFASALAVGVTSDAEYLDTYFTRFVTEQDMAQLQAVLPNGLHIMAWRAVPDAAPALMSVIGAARWELSADPKSIPGLQRRINKLMAEDELTIIRQGKKGTKTADIRPLVYELSADEKTGQILMLLAAGGDGGARPRDVLALLDLPQYEPRLRRKALYIVCGSYLQTPMAVCLKGKEVSVNAEEDSYQLR